MQRLGYYELSCLQNVRSRCFLLHFKVCPHSCADGCQSLPSPRLLLHLLLRPFFLFFLSCYPHSSSPLIISHLLPSLSFLPSSPTPSSPSPVPAPPPASPLPPCIPAPVGSCFLIICTFCLKWIFSLRAISSALLKFFLVNWFNLTLLHPPLSLLLPFSFLGSVFLLFFSLYFFFYLLQVFLIIVFQLLLHQLLSLPHALSPFLSPRPNHPVFLLITALFLAMFHVSHRLQTESFVSFLAHNEGNSDAAAY